MGRRRRRIAAYETPAERQRRSRAVRKDQKDWAPTKIRRMIDDALEGYGNALFGSVLGQLALRQKIEPYHVAAGQRYAGLSLKYHAATGAPPFSRSASLEIGLHASEPDVDTPLGRELSLTERDVIVRMHRAEDVLHRAGRNATAAVRDVCELDRDPGAYRYPDLRSGLHGLAELFSLTPRPGNVT